MIDQQRTRDGGPGESLRGAGVNEPSVHAGAQFDDAGVAALYANLCRVASTPEEVILDLGLNSDPLGTPVRPIRISQRVVLNHYTAKRLATMLGAVVARHERTFGTLETDVRKRVLRTGEAGTDGAGIEPSSDGPRH